MNVSTDLLAQQHAHGLVAIDANVKDGSIQIQDAIGFANCVAHSTQSQSAAVLDQAFLRPQQ
jgi:hypothetical protein